MKGKNGTLKATVPYLQHPGAMCFDGFIKFVYYFMVNLGGLVFHVVEQR